MNTHTHTEYAHTINGSIAVALVAMLVYSYDNELGLKFLCRICHRLGVGVCCVCVYVCVCMYCVRVYILCTNNCILFMNTVTCVCCVCMCVCVHTNSGISL